jgi:hypothetical protein
MEVYEMNNLREVNDDLLKYWLLFREDEISSLSCDEDRNHWVYFDEISDKILNSIPKKNRAFVQKQLSVLDDNFLDYLAYWNEKYYRNGFCDGVQLIEGCCDNNVSF